MFSNDIARWYAGGALGDYSFRVITTAGAVAVLAAAPAYSGLELADGYSPAVEIERAPLVPAGGTALLQAEADEAVVMRGGSAELAFRFYR